MARLKLITDETCRCHREIKDVKFIDIVKQDIFSYGVFNHEIPPDKIGEYDFEYLQSKVPAYYELYDDHIDMSDKRQAIICKVPGEAAKIISEIVGVAVGLKTAKTLFKFRKRDISKIGLSGNREKRLDFTINYNGNKIEVETKGTTGSHHVNAMIEDIHKKKEGKVGNINRYGFVTLLRKAGDSNDSKIYVTDPESFNIEPSHDGVYKYISYYKIYFSFILDNPQYNKIVRVLKNTTRYKMPIIKIDKIKYSFEYNGKKYFGQCFDKRLIIDNIYRYARDSKNLDQLYKLLTKNIGKEKYFLGVDADILNEINNKNEQKLLSYVSYDKYERRKGHEYIQMSDGLLFIKSKSNSLPIMEEQFTEMDVKTRLGEIYSYIGNEWHECGAPCRSREKEGKPCEIKTYRGHCHFHR